MESDEVKAEIEALWNANDMADDENPGSDQDADGEPDLDAAEPDKGSGGYVFLESRVVPYLEHSWRYIDQLGEILTSFLRELQEETGWAFTVLGGGLNREGDIKIVTYVFIYISKRPILTSYSSHIGTTTAGSIFPQICNNYQDHILQEFVAFVKVRHR